MSKQWVLVAIILIMTLSISACEKPQQSPQAIQIAGDNQTWFDAPLNGIFLPLAPYEIVLHGYTGNGVTQVELNANGSLLANLPNPGVAGNLVTFKYTWTPASIGNYILSARTQGTDGNWGGVTTVNVTVGDIATVTPTITPSPTITTTPLISFTPTVTPTVTLTETLIPTQTSTTNPQLVFTRTASTGQFFYGDCAPRSVTVKVQVSDPNAVGVIVLFQKLQNQGWDGGTSMNNSGGGSYSLTVLGNNVPGHDGVESSVWLHQLVATDSSGAVIARSQNFSDVTLSKCAAAPPPPQENPPPPEEPTAVPTAVPPVIIPVRPQGGTPTLVR